LHDATTINASGLLKSALKDAVRFYAFLLLAYAVVGMVWFLYALISLKLDYAVSLQELEAIKAGYTAEADYVFDGYLSKYVGQILVFCAFFLVCFTVFFTCPPKPFKRVFLAITLICAPLGITYIFMQPSQNDI
jgi:hypothetical protein